MEWKSHDKIISWVRTSCMCVNFWFWKFFLYFPTSSNRCWREQEVEVYYRDGLLLTVLSMQIWKTFFLYLASSSENLPCFWPSACLYSPASFQSLTTRERTCFQVTNMEIWPLSPHVCSHSSTEEPKEMRTRAIIQAVHFYFSSIWFPCI